MALRQVQHIKQTQRLSPLQMQVIKLIELNSIELEDKIKQELEENPALDETIEKDEIEDNLKSEDDEYAEVLSEEDIVKGDYSSDEDMPDFRLSSGSGATTLEQSKMDFAFSGDYSLHQSLLDQINLRKLSDTDKKIGEYIIGNLDENGYLESTLESISDDLIFQLNIDTTSERIEKILDEIQDLEPAGVGARNLQECLLLQLRRKKQSKTIRNATFILEELFDEFTKKHYDKIKRQLNVEYDELRDAIDAIISLNPKPGNTWGDSMEMAMANITPDFIVEIDGQEITMWLNNRNIPPLRVNRGFSEMMKGYSENKKSMSTDNKQALLFMKQKVDSARWFIDAIKQRQNTLQLTMEAIIDLQYDFFITGDESVLKPMILKDVAKKTGFDISTISRVSNSKYVQTHAGIFPLKFFFSEAMQMDSGEDISSREVKIILKQKIENENPSKPLTDEEATKMLNELGYVIARRTVAKYREQLGIPVARLRKKL